jgi:orotidine-5'-phosphate decarboxylase
MGKDAVEPFLSFERKHAILLVLTSNKGAENFQYTLENNEFLFQKVLKKSLTWAHSDRLMYVIGATKANALVEIRKIVPDSFLLVPGFGAQGGSLMEVSEFGMNDQCGLLVNSSRGIIYKSQGSDFAAAAATEASKIQQEMACYLNDKGII